MQIGVQSRSEKRDIPPLAEAVYLPDTLTAPIHPIHIWPPCNFEQFKMSATN